MLASATHSWLLALCDPQRRELKLPRRPLSKPGLTAMLDLAGRHGVLPAVLDNLRRAAAEYGPRRIVSGGSLEEAIRPAQDELAHRIAFSLMLRSQAVTTSKAIAESGVPVVVLKGCEFADRLYPSPSLRSFTDVDLLVPGAAVSKAECALKDAGYEPLVVSMKYKAGYGESRWQRTDGGGGTVEIHWNLVNSPSLRKGLSVDFSDLQYEPVAGGPARMSAASLLLVAGVHAAASHCFDRLQLLCDVCQAVRTDDGKLDEPWLIEAARRTGGGLALAAALLLGQNILGERLCGELAGRLGLRRPPAMLRFLLTRGVILRAGAYRDSFRRQIFREMLKRK